MSRTRVTNRLDWLALALFGAALLIYLTGGFSFRVSGVRVGARSADRAVLAALATIVLRLALDRRTRPLATAPAVWRRIRAGAYSRTADEITSLPRQSAAHRYLAAALGLGAFGLVLLYPQLGNRSWYTSGVPYMYFSLWHGSQMVNGYSGHEPEDYRDFEKALAAFTDPAVIPGLRARGATHVTVNCAFYRDVCDQVLVALDAMPAFRLMASGKWQGPSRATLRAGA